MDVELAEERILLLADRFNLDIVSMRRRPDSSHWTPGLDREAGSQ